MLSMLRRPVTDPKDAPLPVRFEVGSGIVVIILTALFTMSAFGCIDIGACYLTGTCGGQEEARTKQKGAPDGGASATPKTEPHPHCAAKVCPDPESACYCNICGGWCP